MSIITIDEGEQIPLPQVVCLLTGAPIMICGDMHGDIHWWKKVLEHAQRLGVEVIYQMGDMAILYPDGASPTFEEKLSALLVEFGIEVYFIDGNHDNHERLALLDRDDRGFAPVQQNLTYLPRGSRWIHDGIRFGALGGAYTVYNETYLRGFDWWDTEEPTMGDVYRLGSEPLDVLLTHDAPTAMDLKSMFKGLPEEMEERSRQTRILIDAAMKATKPKRVFCGHWHQPLHQEFPDGSSVSVLDLQWSRFNKLVLDPVDLSLSGHRDWAKHGLVPRTLG